MRIVPMLEGQVKKESILDLFLLATIENMLYIPK